MQRLPLLLLCLRLSQICATSSTGTEIVQATVYVHEHQPPTIELGRIDRNHGAAVAEWVPESSGWSKLKVEAVGNSRDSTEGSYSMGFAEGFLTHQKIEQLFSNAYNDWFGSDESLRDPVYAWLDQNMRWTRNQTSQNHTNGDLYWKAVRTMIAQLDGLYQGYQAATKGNGSLTYPDFLLLNGDGDVEALSVALGLSTQRTPNLRCSAAFKITPGNKDILFAHATWDHYTMMAPRVLKSYSYGPHTSISMSSSPGFLSSIDDFYLTSHQLAVIETTNGNFNQSLWREITPYSMLSWIRSSVANLLSSTTTEWADTFARLNSGTYNNQWMILDMKNFKPGHQLRSETFRVLEQLPNLIRSEDKSEQLQHDTYWASYNIPYFADIWRLSGFGEQSPKDEYSHADCPRAQIFRAQHANVTDIEGMKHLIRYNKWETDPASKANPCNGISARCDLNKPGTKHYQLEGGLDGKASSVSMARNELQFVAQLGPTHDNQPVFDWSKVKPSSTYPKLPVHDGSPTRWDFDWTTFSSAPIVP